MDKAKKLNKLDLLMAWAIPCLGFGPMFVAFTLKPGYEGIGFISYIYFLAGVVMISVGLTALCSMVIRTMNKVSEIEKHIQDMKNNVKS